MCELKVHVSTAEGNREVTHDIVYASLETGHVALKDVLGVATKVPDAMISKVDIGKESLYLRQSSMLAPFLRFIDALQKAETNQDYAEAEESWNELKAKGDETIRSLWRKSRRSP